MNEEDIKILENFIKEFEFDKYNSTEKIDIIPAIENLINRNKELEEIEESHRKENGELRERIKQLEDTNKKLYEIGKEIGKQDKYTSENYIPKSKVEEKIEHYQELQKDYIEKCDEINPVLEGMINVLQVLLEE